MSKLYVFGIGGTGSRVLRALTMLLASGVKCNDEIVPIIVDPDDNNGDLTRTITLMKKYKEIHDDLSFSNSQKNEFFKTNLMEDVQNYLFSLRNVRNVTFNQFMEVPSMSDENQALIKALFSEKNLASDMQVGFKGNPNIGSVVLNQFAESQEFHNLANNFKQGDRIFIISSIFGGTGASGFPLLLKTFRHNNSLPNFGLLNNAKIGAVTVLPYFTVEKDSKSSIESETFISKTKSALSYYYNNITGNDSIDQIYYIGDNQQATDAYHNVEGGSGQCNKAHFIELVSALSVLDFANNAGSTRNPKTVYKEFGLQSDNVQSIIFGDFGNTTIDMIRTQLVQYFIMHCYLKDVDFTLKSKQQWVQDNGFDSNFFNSNFMRNLEFMLNDFEVWLKEMEDNKISFAPFTWNEEDIFKRVKGIEPVKIGVFSKLFGAKEKYELFDLTLDKEHRNLPKGLVKQDLFMELFYVTTQKLLNDKLKI